jgi:hypothetical protein
MTISGTPSRASSTASGVPELVGREAPPYAGPDGGPAQVRPRGGTGPVPATAQTVDDAQQRPDGQLESHIEPRLQLVPTPGVHADLAPSAAPSPRRTSSAPRC